MTLTIGSLCSGYGGLDLGVQQVLDARVAWHCEYAAAPSKILAHHWPDVPNHRDLTTTDWAAVEPVDIITAGWPCQPWSLAGKGKGADDERAIWPAIADAVRALRPRYVFLENVAAVVVLGELARAVGDLARFGYDAQWQCLRASDVGAPHGRNRCFIVATDATHLGHERGRVARDGRAGPANGGDAAADATSAERGGPEQQHLPAFARSTTEHRERAGAGTERGAASANASGHGRHEGRPEPTGVVGGSDAAECGADVQWGVYEPAIRRWERATLRPAPRPTEPGSRGGQRLSPAFVEFMMGLPAGHVTDVPDLSRNDQLKALGNGVVPAQAAAAYAALLGATALVVAA